MSKTIWYLHGAYATSKSFNWLTDQLPEHEAVFHEYETRSPIERVVNHLVTLASVAEEPVDIIGHSLGGVIALAVAQRSNNIRRIATMSAPFGGSKAATTLRWFSPKSILDDIHPNSSFIRSVQHNMDCLRSPTISIVTEGASNPMMMEANDGVVTVNSQMALPNIHYVMRNVNHFEVLLDETVKQTIEGHLW
jgi:esterase/lipase